MLKKIIFTCLMLICLLCFAFTQKENSKFISEEQNCYFVYEEVDADVDNFLNPENNIDSTTFDIIDCDSTLFNDYFNQFKNSCSSFSNDYLKKFSVKKMFYNTDSVSVEITKVYLSNNEINNTIISYGKNRYCIFSWKS